MLLLYFMVGASLAVPEITLVMQYPKLYELMKRNKIFEISFSLGLGIILSLAMGIDSGVTFAIGNMFGTMITKAIYGLKLIERSRAVKKSYVHRKQQAEEILDTLSDLVRIIRAIISFPRRVIRDALLGLNTIAKLFHR